MRALALLLLLPACVRCGDEDKPDPTGETGPVDTGDPDTGDGDTGEQDTGDPPLQDRDGDGWTEADGDCDDDDSSVFPGAEEQPGDGQDNDCDGLVDLDASTVWDADLVWAGVPQENEWSEHIWSMLGWHGIAVLSDLDGDGGSELVTSTHHTLLVLESTSIAAGGLLSVIDVGTAVLPEDLDDPGDPDVGYGCLLFAAGDDLGDDGRAELAVVQVSSPDWALAIYDSETLAGGGTLTRSDYRQQILLEDANTVGDNMLWRADYDGDGLMDIVWGEPESMWSGGRESGRVSIVSGATLALAGDVSQEDIAVSLWGDTEDDFWIGIRCLHAGDVDGDGHDDLVVGGRKYTALISGADLLGSHDQERLDLAVATIDHEDAFWPGQSVDAGDLDGDGRDDLLLYEESDNLEIDGQVLHGQVSLFMDLGDGGMTSWTQANAHLYSSMSALVGVAGPVALRPGGQDLLVSDYEGVKMLDLAELPTEGLIDLWGWEDRIDADGTWFHHGSDRGNNLLGADLDGDGDDDIVAGAPLRNEGFESSQGRELPAGIVSIFLNPATP